MSTGVGGMHCCGAHPHTTPEREPSSDRSMQDGFEAIINNSRLFSVPWPLRAEDGLRSGQNSFGTVSRCAWLTGRGAVDEPGAAQLNFFWLIRWFYSHLRRRMGAD